MYAGIFFGGIGIQVGAYQFKPVQYLVGAAFFGFLKQQVFNKMRQASLCFGSSREPAFTTKQQCVMVDGECLCKIRMPLAKV